MDSTRVTNKKHILAQGGIDPDELDELVDELDNNSDAINIVFLHHPIVGINGNIPLIKEMELDNYQTIATKLKKADLVLSGHFHKSFCAQKTQNHPNFAVASTATQILCKEKNNFLVLDIYSDRIICNNYEYRDKSTGPNACCILN